VAAAETTAVAAVAPRRSLAVADMAGRKPPARELLEGPGDGAAGASLEVMRHSTGEGNGEGGSHHPPVDGHHHRHHHRKSRRESARECIEQERANGIEKDGQVCNGAGMQRERTNEVQESALA
jgi:hypothetical protein